MSRSRVLALTASAAIMVAAVGAPAFAQDLQPPTATPNPVPAEVPSGDGTGVRIKTDEGDIVIGVFTESAPVASQNFINLVDAGFYDGLGFHRIVEDFVIQGGESSGDGSGGPGYTIQDEEVVGQYGRGIVAMARTPAPDSQGSQFFVVLDDAARPALESANTYVIFGRVIEGMDVVDAIAARGPYANVIEDPVIMRSVTVEQVVLPPEPTPGPPTASEVAAAALASLIPTEIGGLALETETVVTEDFLFGADEDPGAIELASLAEASGASLSELAVAIGGGDDGEAYVTMLGASLDGLSGAEIAAPMQLLVLGELGDTEVSQESIAGTDVTALTSTDETGVENTIYIVTTQDAVWFVLGDPETVQGAIASLN